MRPAVDYNQQSEEGGLHVAESLQGTSAVVQALQEKAHLTWGGGGQHNLPKQKIENICDDYYEAITADTLKFIQSVLLQTYTLFYICAVDTVQSLQTVWTATI